MFIFAMVSFVALSIVACSKDYADINHTHDQYANTDHSHDQYADTNHTHDGYADTNHTHNETQFKKYEFNIQFAATTGASGDQTAHFVKELPETIDATDVVLVYGKSHFYNDNGAYDAWPLSIGLLSYSYTVCFGTKRIAFIRHYNLNSSWNAETIAMRVFVIPATVVVTAKAANVDVNDYMAMTAYLKSIGETIEVQTID